MKPTRRTALITADYAAGVAHPDVRRACWPIQPGCGSRGRWHNRRFDGATGASLVAPVEGIGHAGDDGGGGQDPAGAGQQPFCGQGGSLGDPCFLLAEVDDRQYRIEGVDEWILWGTTAADPDLWGFCGRRHAAQPGPRPPGAPGQRQRRGAPKGPDRGASSSAAATSRRTMMPSRTTGTCPSRYRRHARHLNERQPRPPHRRLGPSRTSIHHRSR